MAISKKSKIFAALMILLPSLASAQFIQRTYCKVPLEERKSAPSIDLLDKNGSPIDPGRVIDLITKGQDTSNLEPQKSDLYLETPLTTISYSSNFPSDKDVILKPLKFLSYNKDLEYFKELRMSQAQVMNTSDQNTYTLTVSFDSNAAVARSALLRKLGYNIPSPRFYSKISVTFDDIKSRDLYLKDVSRMRNMMSWVVGGEDEVRKNNLTITLMNVVLESTILMNLPPFHWGIFKPENLQSRRTLRALLVPLTLLDIDESVNMYSYEPAKIDKDNLIFSRVFADRFEKETTIGDVKWIAKKIARLTPEDWTSIIQAGHYPPDIEALILQKTMGRVNQLVSLLKIQDSPPLPYNIYITQGSVFNGKAYQDHYDGYPQVFTYGDPVNPLRFAELVRYFGVELISNGVKFALDQANKYLQVVSVDKYIKKHTEKLTQDIITHVENHPGEPYVQPIKAWGGPIAGGGVTANRSVVTGTYYGSTSPVQMVDAVSVNARVGAFIGISGLKSVGLSFSPTLSYNRSYVHVRPINDIKTALKDNWTNVAVPFTMAKLSNVLLQKEGEESSATIENFLKEMKTGEMFIVVDGLTLSNSTMLGIPVGAMLGFAAPLINISETITGTNQYAILSRTTIYKSEKGLQVYTSRINTKTHGITADTDFILRLFTVDGSKMSGNAHTEAYTFPSEFKDENEQKLFLSGMRSLLRKTSARIIEQNFKPYQLDHDSDGKRLKFKVGPWQWSKRETIHRLDITQPEDTEGKYDAEKTKRTVIQGQINKITGWDFYGFFGSVLNKFYTFINLGGAAKGDDPASNFMGKSKSLVVSTELETTDSQPNKTLVRVQETYTGWTMRKEKLLKLLKAMGKKLENFNQNDGLIDEDSFAQTKRVQAYNVIWSLSIYEPGLEKILNVLNTNTSDTRAAMQELINLMGKSEYEKFCRDQHNPIDYLSGPINLDNIENRLNRIFETVSGQTTIVTCATPWMQSIFDLRDKLRKHSEVFAKDVHDEDLAQDKIHWINKVVMKLESVMDLSLLIKWAGKDQSYFKISVAGYRKGDERAQDDEGRSTYFSNTIGSINSDIQNGPMDEISRSSLIMEHELSARYLSDGF